VRHGGFAARGGVVDASGAAAFVDAVEAVGGANAGAHFILAALGDLLADVRVGDVGTGHADHVELAFGHGVAGGGHVVDARGVKHRELRLGANLAGEVEVRGRRHAGDGDDA
jgi:hypothetical protein